MKKSHLILLLIALLLLFVGGWKLWSEKAAAPAVPVPAGEETEGTYQFPDSALHLTYPKAILTAETASDGVRLTHRVPYDHTDPCDFKGDAPQKTDLVDFDVRFTLSNQKLEDAVREKEGDAFMNDNWKNGNLVLSQGFIEAVQAGDLEGFQLTLGVENCGMYHFYFPITADQTLVVERAFVTEFRDDVQRDLALQAIGTADVLLPEEEEELFQEILKSLNAGTAQD